MADPVLKIDGLEVLFPGFAGDVHAVNGVDLEVQPGEIVGLVGESGSAKSVTAMTALRLLPDGAFRQDGGKISLLGRDVQSMSEREMNRLRGGDVAMIFQEPQTALNPTKTIGKQMLRVIELHSNLRGMAARDRAIELLKDMRINDAEEILGRYPFELSGGMRQRILIGMAFACSPKLLVADEPTTALDVTVQRQVLQLLHAKARQTGASVLFISHDLAVISQFCDRIYVMYAGRVVETGPAQKVLGNPQHPYTAALIEALPEDADPGAPLASIPGTVPNLVNPPKGCAFQARCCHARDACNSRPSLTDVGKKHQAACWLCEEVTA
ncbi:MAG: ABC transporter ATP-binding protein [Shimia sp.]|jgi:peptide/nickel transport system ATP-binding protein|uniref:ABC transporter ATP-binding protein n=1 Tax=Shimia sp. TaxID=1954381 RepID=UPI0025CDBB61|nr:ABC transporter ATP-binding protein [Shimia sp.]MCH2068134.1 ABC transporter ATP-binding protein [Shimia sp.]